MAWDDRRSPWKRQPDDARTPYEVDRARIIHSGSFRRLQGKTQILNLGDSDFYRTRLTHSLEVAQIGAGLVRQLEKDQTASDVHPHLPPECLMQVLGYSHDLGHPPFGHGGEIALNYCMRDAGGFEGNGQTLRLLSRLEDFSKSDGANLARRTLLGILKYPIRYSEATNADLTPMRLEGPYSIAVIDRKACKPPKCYLDDEADVVHWLLEEVSSDDRNEFLQIERSEGKHAKSLHKSLDCTLLDLADDIAYGVHDLEDVIAIRLMDEGTFRERINKPVCQEFLEGLRKRYGEGGNDPFSHWVSGLFSPSRKRFISRLVHHFMTSVEAFECESFSEPLLRFRVRLKPAARAFLDELQKFVVTEVIESAEVQHLEFKGQQMVVSVYEALKSEPGSMFSADARLGWEKAENKERAICDYVAGMTDAFLLRTYERMFSPRMGSVFDKL